MGEKSKEMITCLEYWKTPNDFLIYELYFYHLLFKRHFKEYSHIDQEIWILKPVSKSKGVGIQLVDKKNTIKQLTKDSQKLTQQYIHNPLLIQKKKFDIRIWVLLTSIQPLEVYYFPQFYLRLCSQEYDRENLGNLFCHLTNFSINQTMFERENDSVFS